VGWCRRGAAAERKLRGAGEHLERASRRTGGRHVARVCVTVELLVHTNIQHTSIENVFSAPPSGRVSVLILMV
jgi:hypothetical protein